MTLEDEVQHWRANHACEVQRSRVLKERLDMPIERVMAYEHLVKCHELLTKARVALLDAGLSVPCAALLADITKTLGGSKVER